MSQDQPFKADPGHIADFGRRSAADIFNEVIVPVVNEVSQLIPVETEESSPYDEPQSTPQFRVDKAFLKPEDEDPLAQMYRSRTQPQ